jgi:hypothetical protein
MNSLMTLHCVGLEGAEVTLGAAEQVLFLDLLENLHPLFADWGWGAWVHLHSRDTQLTELPMLKEQELII